MLAASVLRESICGPYISVHMYVADDNEWNELISIPRNNDISFLEKLMTLGRDLCNVCSGYVFSIM